ncbi:hypothetical protein I6F65_18640 [Pseudoalteromonas sp. SWXJZ94C]|uniref:hypothetical protein n=1 Tax=unclassified Pseudoalteromonas TaxID=194690 RepID=UPI0014072908|nr:MULTISPECIES: hypothetical protein [unclassified Pseudoalteromonas]MBH0058964.1 hypothetical protein [Pseudoalteromonas sp. SWXJZ94C]
MIFRTTTCFIIAFTLGACKSTPVQTKIGGIISPNYVFLTNVQQAVNVGEVMTSSAPLLEHKQVIISTPIKAETPHRNKVFNVTVEPGLYRLIAEDNEGQFYEAEDTVIDVNLRKGVGGIYIPNEKQRKPALYWHWEHSLKNSPNGVVYVAYFDDLPKYKSTNVIQASSNHGFVSTITYAGIAGGQIKLVYREYTDGLAREAFTQEVALDYVPESTYAYKNAKFIIHNANNMEVSYTLKTPL